ncbi:PLOD3 [Symbiodinium microadriaticum]|nr:PLOD3 [Symbiodinium microadriaticum]
MTVRIAGIVLNDGCDYGVGDADSALIDPPLQSFGDAERDFEEIPLVLGRRRLRCPHPAVQFTYSRARRSIARRLRSCNGVRPAMVSASTPSASVSPGRDLPRSFWPTSGHCAVPFRARWTPQGLLDTTLQPEDLVMLLDAWDTVILAPADELRAKLTAIPPKTILGGTERVCGPNHFLVAQMEALYPDGTTPWRYPNSGGLVGPAETMADLLHGLIHDTDSGGSLPAEENDQVRLHDFLIARAARGSRYPFVLDTQCSVFQCMYEEQPQWDVTCDSDASPPKPRIENRQTLQRPVVAHGNGHTGRWFLSALYSEMKLLDHLGLRMEELQHLQHEMPVPPGTEVTEEIKAEYCPWWYMPGVHKGATDGFATFRMIREMQCGPARQR